MSGDAALTPDEALRLLGLGPAASVADVDHAWKQAQWQAHPDRPSGSEHEARRLNLARELARAHIEARDSALIPHVANALEQVRSAIRQAELRHRQEVASQEKIVFANVRGPRMARRVLWLTAAISAGSAILQALVPSKTVINGFAAPILSPIVERGFLIATAFATIGWYYGEVAKDWEARGGVITETLAQRNNFYVLANNLLSRRDAAFTRAELVTACAAWIATSRRSSSIWERAASSLMLSGSIRLDRVAASVGPEDFGDFVIAVGLNRGFLSEGALVLDGVPTSVYTLR